MFGVLVVEDEPIIVRHLASCVSGNRWLMLAGVAATEHDAIQMACRIRPALVLLDFGLGTPMGGFDVWDALHKLDPVPEVIAVTSANDMRVVDKARKYGVFGYVVKPFTRADMDAKLAHFTRFHRSAMVAPPRVDQSAIELFFDMLRQRPDSLPGGLLAETLASIRTVLQEAERTLRADEIADRVGLKRETANRYLKYLCGQGVAVRVPKHEGPGHPAFHYQLASMWTPPPADPGTTSSA
jgi:two-component system, CitB family, response regulator DctR